MRIFKRLKKDFWQTYQDFGFKTHSKTAIGIDFGSSAIRCVRVLESKKGIEILDIIIQNLSNLTDALNQLKPALDEEVYVSFSDVEVLTKRIALPEMSEDELKDAIRWELKDQLSFKIDEAVLDFKIIGRRRFSDGSIKLDILATFVKEALLEEKISSLKELGLNISGVSYCGLALTRFSAEFNFSEPIALIDIGSNSTRFSIVENGRLQFVRELNLGGEDLTKALTGTLSSPSGRLALSRDEAERLKIELGISKENPQLFSMIRPLLERLSNQIKISLEYYENQFSSQTIKELFLTGNGSKLGGLKEFLKTALSKEVSFLGLPDRVTFKTRQPIPSIVDEILPDIATAIGLALDRGSKSLLPKGLDLERKRRLERFLLRNGIILILIITIFSYAISSVRLSYLRKVFIAQKTQWRSLEEIEKLKNSIVKLHAATQAICYKEIYPGEVMRELSFITPSHISFKQIRLDRSKKRLGIKGVILTGNQPAEARLGEFMATLEDSRIFEKVVLVETQRSDELKTDSSEFELVCEVSEF